MQTSAIAARGLAAVVLAIVGAGVYVVLSTLAATDWRQSLPWAPGALSRLVALVATLAVAIVLVARLLRLAPVSAALVTAAATLTMLGAAWPVLLLAALALAFTLVGGRLRQWWRDDAGEPDALTDMVLGAGTYASVIGVLAHWPINHPALYAVLIALPIVADRRQALAILKSWLPRRPFEAGRVPFAAWIVSTLGVVYAVVALFPELGWDALAMHLFMPGRLVALREWSFDAERFAWALMPALGDWLYALPQMFDGVRGTRLLNAACTVLIAVYVHRFATLAGATRGWAAFAAALWLSTPVTFTVGSSVFIDAPWSLFVLGGIDSLLRPPVPGRPPRSWITAGAFLGFAAAAKAVTFPLLPAIAVAALAHGSALRVPGMLRVVALALAVGVLAGAKPYVTAWALTGNPVYPFFVHVFGGPPFDYWTSGPTTFRAPLAWSTVYDATFNADRYIEGRTGSPGFQWLILLPASLLALLASRSRRALLLAVIGVTMIAGVFAFQSYLRYVLPGLALLTATFAVAGTALQTRAAAGGVVLAAAGSIVIALNLAYLNAAGTHREFPVGVLASERARQMHVARALPVQRATELAVRLPATGSRLAFFSIPAFAIAPHVDVVHASWYTPRFQRSVREATSPEALAQVLADWQIRYVIVDEWWSPLDPNRHVERATVPVVQLDGASVREVRSELFFANELVRNADFGAADGWTFVAGARHDPVSRVAIVDVDAPAYQPIAVRPGAVYRNAVRARCEGTGTARAQVNWLNASHKLLSASLQTFACGDRWNEHVQEVVAPPAATIAVVYAAAGGSTRVEFGMVSFRSPTR